MAHNTSKVILFTLLAPLSYSATANIPKQSYFEKRCMSAWKSLQTGDKQAIFDQFSPKLQNWQDGKPAWEEVERNFKDYNDDWTQSKLDDLNITLLSSDGRGPDGTKTKTGLQSSVDKHISVYYPKATRQYDVLYDFKTGNHLMGKTCTFYELDKKWYLHHLFL